MNSDIRSSTLTHKSLLRYPIWLALLLCAHFLAGFPGSGPMLTSEADGYAVQTAPPDYVHVSPVVASPAPSVAESKTESKTESEIESEEARIKRILQERQMAGVGQSQSEGVTVYSIALPLVQTGSISETVSALAPSTLTPVQVQPSRLSPVWDLAWDGQARTVRVPVLMYHYLSIPPADANAYRTDLSVSPDLFARQLDRIQAEGYTTVSLYDLLAHLWQGAPLPERPVVLTFDDGYRDNYANAFPLLRERGMIATIFVVTDFMDEARPEYLTWEMAREMQAAGFSIESHGRNHISLKNRDNAYLVWQALGSLETIQFEMGVRPRFISYPAGEFDDATIAIFQSANYWAGFTTIQGATHSTDEPFRLHRVRVRNTTEPDELIRLLELDW